MRHLLFSGIKFTILSCFITQLSILSPLQLSDLAIRRTNVEQHSELTFNCTPDFTCLMTSVWLGEEVKRARVMANGPSKTDHPLPTVCAGLVEKLLHLVIYNESVAVIVKTKNAELLKFLSSV